MKESSDGFVRADQIDLKSLDEQLERHLNKVLTLEKSNTKKAALDDSAALAVAGRASFSSSLKPTKRKKEEWKIDPSKLLVKSVIARGTFGTVHRGVYDSLDVAG